MPVQLFFPLFKKGLINHVIIKSVLIEHSKSHPDIREGLSQIGQMLSIFSQVDV